MQSSLETKLVFLYYKTGRQTSGLLVQQARLYLLLPVNQPILLKKVLKMFFMINNSNYEKDHIYMPPKCDIVVLSTEYRFLGSNDEVKSMVFEDEWEWD